MNNNNNNNMLVQITNIPKLSVFETFQEIKEIILSGTVKETRVFQYFHFQNKIFELLKKDKQTKSAFDTAFSGYGKGQFVLDGFICNKYDKETGVDFSCIEEVLQERKRDVKEKVDKETGEPLAIELSEDDINYLQDIDMQLDIFDTYKQELNKIEEAKAEVKKLEEYFRQNLADCISVKTTTVIEISTKRAE